MAALSGLSGLTAFVRRAPAGGSPHRNLVLDYADDLKLFRGPWRKLGLGLLIFLYLWAPGYFSNYVLGVLTICGVYAVGVIGLNLLTGYAGQVSLGHAFFFGAGGYAAAYLGAQRDWPMLLFLPAAALIGFVVGAVVGPFALRLRGNYLVIVTLGLVFLGEHIWKTWDSVTGGGSGTSLRGASVSIGGLDFRELEIAGSSYEKEQGMFWLVWAIVAIVALLAKNLVRSRAGRAMQAVRDRDLSAEVIGVNLARYKVGAFAWSSALAALSGALYGIVTNRLETGIFTLFLSITFVAMLIIGGVGTIFGSILGALLVSGGQQLIARNSSAFVFDPIIIASPGDSGFLSIGEFNNILFGLFIVVFLMFEPRGLAALWLRAKAWLLTWPFSY
ncbi:MAG: branched-chain amino acid ABC transporter permease [Acidimicrobiales bacterium]|nr:branched-chain amino acid ABC transporter permease [Acidimicrobiales bacterium]